MSTEIQSFSVNTLQRIEYKNQAVITTAILAECYNTDPANIISNFKNHSSCFKSGKHYISLKDEELQQFKDGVLRFDSIKIPKNINELILWTQKGASLHARMLDTDLVWDTFEVLKERYFYLPKNPEAITKAKSNTQIVVADQEIQPIEFNNKRVVTFEMIDQLHQRPKGTASRNFKSNKKYFVDNEDFYFIDFKQKDEIRPFDFQIPTRGLITLTESGYLLLVKSFTDELAWKVQKELVNNYFRVKEIVNSEKLLISSLSDSISNLARLLESNLIKSELTQPVVKEADSIVTNMSFHTIPQLHRQELIRLVKEKASGNKDKAKRLKSNLLSNFGVKSYLSLRREDFDHARKFIKSYRFNAEQLMMF